MVRIIYLSLFLFAGEIFLFLAFDHHLLAFFNNIDMKYLTFNEDQRRVFAIIRGIDRNNEAGRRAVYIMGGSMTREFFLPDEVLEGAVGKPVLNAAASYQTSADSLRLIDNIRVPGSVVVFTMHPYRFMWQSRKDLIGSKYLYGEYFKYTLPSETAESVFADLRIKSERLEVNILPKFNVYPFLLKTYLEGKTAVFDMLFSGREYSPEKVNKLFINQEQPRQYLYRSGRKPEGKIREGLLAAGRSHAAKDGGFGPSFEMGFYLLERAYRAARQRDLTFVLYDLPLSMSFLEVFSGETAVYDGLLETFKRNHPALLHYRLPRSEGGERQEYFFDYGHLNDAGREYFKPVMIEGLRQAIEDS